MKLTAIKQALSNVIETNQLLNQTNRIKLSAENELAPIFTKLAEVHDNKLVSNVGKQLTSELERFNRKLEAKKFFAILLKATNVIARESATLEKSLDGDSFESVLRESMNVKQGHIIQFITLADYFLEATRSLAVVIQEAEVYHLRNLPLERNAQRYIEDNFDSANLQSIASLVVFFASKEKEDVISKIYELPDIKVDESILNTIQSTEGMGKIDPAGFNPLNIINPLFYAFTAQKIWSEIKFSRLEKAQKEIMYLELRHQELILLREGRNNPDLERKINKYQDAIQGLRSKIKRIKERLG